MTGCDLRECDLTVIRDDVRAVLSSAPADVPALRNAIMTGQVDGSSYDDGCGHGCLVGTIAIARGCRHDNIAGLPADSSRPAERFFLAIQLGDTPENSQFSAIVLEWVDQFLANMKAAFDRW